MYNLFMVLRAVIVSSAGAAAVAALPVAALPVAAAAVRSDEEVQGLIEKGTLKKLKVGDLKAILEEKGESTAGKKVELVQRVETWFGYT